MKKITKATIKSFIKKNYDNIYVKVRSSFDGMTDACEPRNNTWKKGNPTDLPFSNTLGIGGIWLVRGSKNYFSSHEDEEFIGYEVSNCCGIFYIGVKK